jgi:hypothetical protein
MAMRIRPYSAERIAQYGRSKATLDATGCHHWANNGHRFWRKKSSCGVVKSLFTARIKKAQNRPSNQLIEATSCIERSNIRIKAEEHS